MSIQKSTIIYKQVPNCPIHADVFLPAAANPPVVLFFHGGALISGTRGYLPAYQVERLTQAGFAVASFDYRLAPETKLAEIVRDIQDALLWVKGPGAASFGFNPKRAAVMGSSAGGYLSLLAGTFAEKPNAIVSFYGYGDILGDWYTRPSEFYCRERPRITWEEAQSTVGGPEKSSGEASRFTYYFYCRQQGTWPDAVSGHHPVTDREELLRYCPVFNIGAEYPPTLLLHGDQDNDVPFEQSLQMSTALENRGIENQLIRVKGAGHGFDGDEKNPERKAIFERVVNFLETQI